MFNKATDAVSKMTIKMNESDIVSSYAPQMPWEVLIFLRWFSFQLKEQKQTTKTAPEEKLLPALYETFLTQLWACVFSVVRGEAARGGMRGAAPTEAACCGRDSSQPQER